MLVMLVCATCWLSMHLYMLVYMFMHKSCLLVCRPYFNTMKIWTPDPNPWTPPFVFFLACLPSCLFSFFLASLLAMSITLICFMPLSYALCIFSFHCLSTGFLSLPLHMERGHMELGHGFPSASKKKGRGCKHVDISQATMFSRFRSFILSLWLFTLLNPLLPHPFLP